MLKRIIAFSIEQWLLILSLTVLLVALGLWSAVQLPIDAVPDVTNVQVQINTVSPALSPLEMERQVTYPIEVSMLGVPGVEEVRSLSKFGLAQVTVVFHDDVNIYFARQLVQERLQKAREEIPEGLGVPEMGPVSTGLGQIFQYVIETPGNDLTGGRTMEDWVVRPQLRTVPGVAEINAFGGLEKQYQVLVRPDALIKYDLTLRQVLESVTANNLNEGGGYIVKGAEQFIVRGVGRVETLDQIRNVILASRDGTPIRVQDVADVEIGSVIRQGAVTKDGKGETVAGIVMMLQGANSRVVVDNVKERFEAVKKSLPPGTKLTPFYDRTELVNRTIRTAVTNLLEGAILVVAVLFLLLGNFRAALIVALTIPLSMLFAMSLMVKAGIAGSLMSLGAIDFGLIVDGSVVMVENSVRHLAHRKREDSLRGVILGACQEIGRPIVFGMGIIIIVFLPILTLEGIEGKMFKPMALTVVFALVGSLILTFTLTPALTLLLLRKKISERENFIIRGLKRVYAPSLRWCFSHRPAVLGLAALSVVAASVAWPFLGSEFIPRLDEGAFAMSMLRLPGISLEECARQCSAVEKKLLEEFPDEVESVVSLIGRAEIATDPTGPNHGDVLVSLKPREDWKRARNREDLEAAIRKSLSRVLGVQTSFSQPIELRVNELIAGVRSDLAIKIYGDDLDVLKGKANEVIAAVSRLPGASGFKAQQVSGLPALQIVVDPDQIARYGINSADVMQVVKALGGLDATEILEGQRRFPLVLKFPEEVRKDKDAIANLLVSAPGGERVPLRSLCRIEEIEGPAEISHEDASRLIVLEGNVRGRDIGSFVADARRLFDERKVDLPPGYRVEFGGQFENLERASTRLLIVVPLSLFLIFLLLFTTFNSIRQAVLVFTGVPLAIVGGVFALLLRGMPFSISAGVGFIALSGVAVLNGVVMVSYMNQLRKEGRSLADAIHEGAMVRFRPVLMTALVASLGFIPMAVSSGSGAEVQRPLATVVIGGLVSATILKLLVLPLLYGIFERKQVVEEQKEALA